MNKFLSHIIMYRKLKVYLLILVWLKFVGFYVLKKDYDEIFWRV